MMYKKIGVLLLSLVLTASALAQVNRVPQLAVPDSQGAGQSNIEGLKATYSAAVTGLVAANSATDIFYITGSATKTIKVTQIVLSGRATAVSSADVQIVKRSTANTAGTCTASTITPHDSNNATAAAVVSQCTANPTTGTLVGAVRQMQLQLGNLTTGLGGTNAVFEFANRAAQAPTLRGATQVLAVNLNGVTFAGNLLDGYIEWTEE